MEDYYNSALTNKKHRRVLLPSGVPLLHVFVLQCFLTIVNICFRNFSSDLSILSIYSFNCIFIISSILPPLLNGISSSVSVVFNSALCSYVCIIFIILVICKVCLNVETTFLFYPWNTLIHTDPLAVP